MAWPSKIYVATVAGGVYYTSNFVDPSTQPTWTAVNDGLDTLDCVEFHLDPFDNFNRQYVVTATTSTLYKRENQGSWVAILDLAKIQALYPDVVSEVITGFYPDPTIEGRILATLYTVWPAGWDTRLYLVYSNDYGATWNTTTTIQSGIGFTSTNIWSVRARGNDVYVGCSFRYNDITNQRIFNSNDLGATWYDGVINEFWPTISINPITPTFAYTNHKPSDTTYISKIDPGVNNSFTDTASALKLVRLDSMWFDPDDALHQRIIYDYKNYVTEDDWSTSGTEGAISPSPISIAPWAGADTDQILVGLGIDVGQDHCIGALYGEDDTSATGIAGANPGTAPYTDSIPSTAGNVCDCGIQAVQPGATNVYTHAIAMPDYDGDDRGIPIQGDRAAWNSENYPSRHTNDIDSAGGIHHTLGTGAYQSAPGNHTHALDDLSDVDAGAPDDEDLLTWDETSGTWIAAPAPGGVIDDHDHSGDAGDGGTFDAANLTSGAAGDGTVLTADGAGGAAWEAIPALSNHDHSGDAGDGGTFDAANLTSGASGDGQVLTSDGAGGAAWEDVPPGGSIALDDISDVNAPTPSDQDVLTWDDGAGEWIAQAPPAGGVVDASDVTYTPAVATDWDGDADPGNADDALDQLAERVDDLEAGGGSGDSTYTAAYASRPAASNDGDLFLPNNGMVLERDTGAAWVPWGPIFPLTTPDDSAFSWVNQGGASVSTTNGGIILLAPASASQNIRIREMAAPATPFTITVMILPTVERVNYAFIHLGFRDSSTGKLHHMRWGWLSSEYLSVTTSSSPTVDVAAYGEISNKSPVLFMRIGDDGTDFTFSWSYDGIHFIELYKVGRTSYLATPDKIWFGADSRNSKDCYATLISWKQG